MATKSLWRRTEHDMNKNEHWEAGLETVHVYVVTFEESGNGAGTAVSHDGSQSWLIRLSTPMTMTRKDKTLVGTLIRILLLGKFGFKPDVRPVQ